MLPGTTIYNPITTPLPIDEARSIALARTWKEIPPDPDLADDLGARRNLHVGRVFDLALVLSLVAVVFAFIAITA